MTSDYHLPLKWSNGKLFLSIPLRMLTLDHRLPSLQVQISAYLDNVFDVAALMEDSETKTAALEKVNELEDELGHVRSRTFWIAIEYCSFCMNWIFH